MKRAPQIFFSIFQGLALATAIGLFAKFAAEARAEPHQQMVIVPLR